MVGGMLSFVPYGTGICHYAIEMFFLLFLSIPI